MTSKVALMVCTQARGGMRSVVEAYVRDGLFERWGMRSLWTHREGGALTRVGVALSAYVEMLGLLVRGRVSFMHVHVAMRGSFWRKSIFMATARRFGVPSIMHLHGSEMKTFYDALTPNKQRAVRQSLEKAQAVVVLSASWHEFIAKIAPQARITVINNYVTLPAAQHQTADSKEFKVLFLGILGNRKGIYDLLESWPAVVQAVPGARLLVGGNGEVELAKSRAASLGIAASVDFLGWVDGARKLELLKTADAFVLPSYNEGLPMSVLEAMSWGKPVVTTRVGGIPELITHELNGLLIEPGDQAALTAALIKLGESNAYREEIGSAGRRRIATDYSDDVVLPSLEAVYQRVVTLRRVGMASVDGSV